MRSRDQFPSPLHSEGPFFVQDLSPALPKAPVLRVTPGQHVISGIPSKLTQLLLLTDLRAESRPAVEFAIELTRLFTARLTLMYGEPLQSGPTFEGKYLPTSPDSDSARPALLCLCGRCGNVAWMWACPSRLVTRQSRYGGPRRRAT